MPGFLLLSITSSVWRWLRHLGGPGLILLGVVDSSVLPSAGSMDVATIWLAAHRRDWWIYYAAMATLGSLLGSYITYSLAQKGGKAALERRLSPQKADKFFKKFESRGFSALAVSALLPPPFPLVPLLLAAGALQYPRQKFLGALAVGRGLRFTILAGLGAVYGSHIIRFFSRYYKPTLYILIALAVLGGVVVLVRYLRHRNRQIQARPRPKAA